MYPVGDCEENAEAINQKTLPIHMWNNPRADDVIKIFSKVVRKR
jgi:hypothetical protein